METLVLILLSCTIAGLCGVMALLFIYLSYALYRTIKEGH